MADEMQDPRLAMQNKLMAMRQAQGGAADQYQGGLALPEQYSPMPGSIAAQGQMRAGQMMQQSPVNPADEPKYTPELIAREMAMKNKYMQNRQAMQGGQQGMMQPQNFGRQPMAPSIQQQAMTQSNGVAAPNAAPGTPAQMPMSGQM